MITVLRCKSPNKTNQHGSLKALRKKTRNTFNTQLFATSGGL